MRWIARGVWLNVVSLLVMSAIVPEYSGITWASGGTWVVCV